MDEKNAHKLTASTHAGAEPGRGLTGQPDAARKNRLPPGQRVVTGLPVLDLGIQPRIDPKDWHFTVAGAVETPIDWDWESFMAQPQTTITTDIHCVTTWSSYDNRFTGVLLSHLFEQVRPKASAQFVMARSFDGYSTNVPLETLRAETVLLAHTWNDKPLPVENGGPVRLLVPSLYFWKSAKWVRHLTFMDRDQPGYWEARGYHMHGDPWLEERYGD